MGLPGSGKGTQGSLLVSEKGMEVISTGALVRARAHDEAREEMLAGKFLSDEEMIELLEARFATVTDFSKVILDGFPRTVTQAEWLLKQVQTGTFTLDAVVFLDVSYEAVKERLLGRGRADDAPEVIEARFEEYREWTEPVLDWFAEHDVAVKRVSGEGDATTIHQEIIKELGV